MQTLNFHLTPALPATPFVSDTLRGGKTIAIAFPEGTTAAIFVQQSVDGTSWQSKQSISPTPRATFSVPASADAYLRVLLSQRPQTAQYEDYDTPGGTEHDPTVPSWAKQPQKPTYTAKEVGAVASVNGVTPDSNGNVSIPTSGGVYATDADIDALWQ